MKVIVCLLSILLCLCSCSQNLTAPENSTTFHGNTCFENSTDNLVKDETLFVNPKSESIQAVVDKDKIASNLAELCSTTRDYGSDGERSASEFLDKKLTEYGYDVKFQEVPVYKQTFDSTIYIESSLDYFALNPYNSEILGTARNIIAKHSKNNDNKKTLYLTAHYDTTRNTTGVIDNGTGVTVILEAARVMKDYDCPYNIEIVIFSAEEYHRSGSRAFISGLSDIEKQNIVACVNVDMVGEKDAGEIVMLTFGGRHNAVSLMFNDKLQLLNGGYSSDDLSFYMGKLPVITLTNKNSNPALAKEDDQFQYVEIDELAKTVTLITDYLYNFDNTVYSDFLTSKMSHINNVAKGKINLDSSFKLIDIRDTLLENGYDSETKYIYVDENQRKFTMTEKVLKFISPAVYSDFEFSESEKLWGYRVESNAESNVKILYKNDSYFGEIKGDISLEEAIKILNCYYRSEYRRIFNTELAVDLFAY